MHRLLTILFILFSLITKAESNEKTNLVKHMSRQEFLTQIWNYEKHPNFKFEGNQPTIIDFYADWCGPCKIAAPILADIAQKYANGLVVYKINTDREKELSTALGISSLPTFLFIPVQGKPVIIQGIGSSKAETKQMFIETIESHLLNNEESATEKQQ